MYDNLSPRTITQKFQQKCGTAVFCSSSPPVTMKDRHRQTSGELYAPDANFEHMVTVETPFISSDSLSKENAADSRKDFLVKNGDVREDGDVTGSDDVTGGGNDVRRSVDVDGGWAWVVLLASCLSLAIQEVMYSVTGMFQVEFQMTFGGSRGFLALIGSIFVTTTGMLGPLAGALSTLLTPRVTVMLGGVILSGGLVSGSFVTSSTSLLLTYGILGGLGNSLIFTPAATAFSGYFVRLRQVANGFLSASAGIGSLVGPYLARWVMDWHGWRYSLAASGFLTAQICVLGALIFPRSGSPRLQLFGRACSTCRDGCPEGEKKEREERVQGQGRGEGDGAGKAALGKQYGDGGGGGGSLGGGGRLKEGGEGSFRHRVWQVLVRREVWILCVNQMLLMTGYNIELMHQPSYIHSLQVDSRHFPNLFLTFGVSMMFIRVVGGFVFTRFDKHLLPAIFLSDMTMALALGLLPLYGVSLPALFVFNILTGLSYGVGFMLAIPVLINFIGVELLPIAYGLMLLCCGSSSILSVSLAGLLYDFLGTYTASFYLAGCLTGTGALVLLLLCCVRGKREEM